MTTAVNIGPLLATAIADAYGCGFEFASAAYIRKHNRMLDYIPHPKFQRVEGTYSDDTQMALGLVEHMLSDDPWTPLNLANRWVTGFHRDQRMGYSKGFYEFLLKTTTGAAFLEGIQPHSIKNGGAMRAFPCGLLSKASEVCDRAMFQASLTHATYEGMHAAAAAALTFHFCYHQLGTREELGPFLEKWLPGTDWMTVDKRPGNGTEGIPTVQKALSVLKRGMSLADVIQMAVALGGDTDTIAAIVAPSAAVCVAVRNAVPDTLYMKLENGTYGASYLRGLDVKLQAKFPRGGAVPARKSKPQKAAAPPRDPALDGPLDFLFDEP